MHRSLGSMPTRPAPLIDVLIEKTPSTTPDVAYEVRFESLFHAGRGLTFPCDAEGHVALQRLSERARASYQRAQEQVGIEYATPAVRRSDLH